MAGSSCTVRIAAGPASTRRAREVVRRTGRSDDIRLALAVTELVANAVTHAGADPLVTVSRRGGVVRLEVFDDGPGWPTLHQSGVKDLSGRGIAMVDRVADRWGVERCDGGKFVWVEIEVAPLP